MSQHDPQPIHQNEYHIDKTDSEFVPSFLKVQKGDDLEHKILDLERYLMELQIEDRSQNKDNFNLRSSFSHGILSESISSRFKIPAIESFNGSANPMDHIKGYRVLMALQGTSDARLYIAFLATLKKIARILFFRLPQRSISSFKQLKRLFVIYFGTNRSHLRYVDSFFSVQ